MNESKPTPEEKCMKPSYERLENNLVELKSAYNEQCEEMRDARECIKRLEGQLEYYKRMIADANEKKFPEIKTPSPEARVDWEKEAREIAQAVMDGWVTKFFSILPEDFEGDKKNIAKIIEPLLAKTVSEAFEKGRETK